MKDLQGLLVKLLDLLFLVNLIKEEISLILLYSPVVQWSSIIGSGPIDLGSNPSGVVVIQVFHFLDVCLTFPIQVQILL